MPQKFTKCQIANIDLQQSVFIQKITIFVLKITSFTICAYRITLRTQIGQSYQFYATCHDNLVFCCAAISKE